MIRKYILSFANQGLISLFHFVINIVLVKLWEPAAYGVFALVLVIVWTLRSVQGAALNSPLGVHAPRLNRRAPRALLELALSSVNALFVLLVFLAVAAGALLSGDDLLSPVAAWAVAAYTAGSLLINYVRAYLFSYLKAGIVTAVDLTFVAISGLAIALALLAPEQTSLASVLGLLAAGSFAGAIVGFVLSGQPLRLTLKPRVLAYYLAPWRDVRWALAGVGIINLQTRAHALIVSASLGAEAFAVLAAGNLLFGPIRMLLVAWGKITRPYLARCIGQDRVGKISESNRLSFIALGLGFTILFSGLYLFWAPIDALIYGDKYADMKLVVAAWGLVSVLSSCRSLLSIPLQSMLAFRQLALLQLTGALTSLVAVTVLIVFADFRLSIFGIALGEAITLLLSWNLYRTENGRLTGSRPKTGGMPSPTLSNV